MARRLKVGLIGSGNVAWHLGPALENAGHLVSALYTRNAKQGRLLQKRLYEAELLPEPDFVGRQLDVVLMAVSDDAIQEVTGAAMVPNGTILAHTSGSQPLSALGYASTNKIGVFYPLQTFSKSRAVEFNHIPILVEAEQDEDQILLMKLGKSLTKQVVKVSSKDRAFLHVAAVFACNFTNHLLTISKDILARERLSFDLLKPLIAETLSKSLELGPENSQTGPAVRGDVETLEKHMHYLHNNSTIAEIYQNLSQHILDMYSP